MGALVGAGIAYGAQVADNLHQGKNLGEALTTDIDVVNVLEGAALGATAVLLAPVAVGLAGDVLMGAGLAAGSAEVFGAGMAAASTAAVMESAIFGTTAAEEIAVGESTLGGESASGGESATVHKNSKLSTSVNHGYEIYEKNTGDVVKTGISGRPLNQNGTSPRANGQVNAWNNAAGYDKYAPRVVATNIPGRAAALEWEEGNSYYLWNQGNSMDYHRSPRPWEH